MAADWVTLPVELMNISSLLAESAAEIVTLLPWRRTGPATVAARPIVIACVFVERPIVSPVCALPEVNALLLNASRNEAPTDSNVRAPLPLIDMGVLPNL